MEKIKILIEINGGLIQFIAANSKNVEVRVKDFDNGDIQFEDFTLDAVMADDEMLEYERRTRAEQVMYSDEKMAEYMQMYKDYLLDNNLADDSKTIRPEALIVFVENEILNQ